MTTGGDFDMITQVLLAKKSGSFDIRKKFSQISFVVDAKVNIKTHRTTLEQVEQTLYILFFFMVSR
jgi:hypothetical protein